MSMVQASIPSVLAQSPIRVVFGSGKLTELGALAKEVGGSRVLVVSDPGIVKAGYVDRAVESLHRANLESVVFDGTRENPTTEHVAAGVQIAREAEIDFIVGLGGGSAMDCAKGINLILTHGGEVRDYWGENKTTKPMLPMIMVPTTAGTGSEAQSFALISDPDTHQKMACGDRRLPGAGGLRPRAAILDTDLILTQPAEVAATAGMDAMSHVVETAATTRRNATSLEFTRQAWLRLEPAFEIALQEPENETARRNMLLGAHLAGAAIEASMLGAAHACANPLTARFGITHGAAVGLMLPHVIRFNASSRNNPYSPICSDAELLACRVERMRQAANLPARLQDCGVTELDLPGLSEAAAAQWTAKFNPHPVGPTELEAIYRQAL